MADIDKTIYYLCGSPMMVTSLHATLIDLGITEDKIRAEDFPGY
jgi:Na+-transporting NADH:ubiquinone oxidoreductase subunit NqrF